MNEGRQNKGGDQAIGFRWLPCVEEQSGAELAPGGCGWTLMRKVPVVMAEANERGARERSSEGAKGKKVPGGKMAERNGEEEKRRETEAEGVEEGSGRR